jgi:hypothetical protein
LPLKEAGEVLCDPVLIAGDHGVLGETVWDDSDTVDDTPERAPFVVTLPLPEPLPFGVCAKKETIFVCGRLYDLGCDRDGSGAEVRGRFGFEDPFPLSTAHFCMKSGKGTLNSLALTRK